MFTRNKFYIGFGGTDNASTPILEPVPKLDSHLFDSISDES